MHPNNYLHFFPKNYWCSWFGHHYFTIQKVNAHFKEFECKFCKRQVTNDSNGKKIELTDQLKEINQTLHYLHIRHQFVNQFYNRIKN